MNTLIWVAVTNLVTYFFCRVYYRRLSTRLLNEQRTELEKACEARITELGHYFNHFGPIPPGASLLGLLNLISLAIRRCVKGLTERFERKDFDTITVIVELKQIDDNEIKKSIKLAAEFLDEKRDQISNFVNFKFKDHDDIS